MKSTLTRSPAFFVLALAGLLSATGCNRGGGANTLRFSSPPSNAVAGQTLSTIVVEVVDRAGHRVESSSAAVSLSLVDAPQGVTLSGTTTVNAVKGVAAFSDLSLTRAGTYALQASATGLDTIPSSSFTVSAAAASQFGLLAQPSDSEIDGVIAPAPRIAVQDAFGNTAEGAVIATAALGANPTGATLHGTTAVAVTNGVADFTELSLDKAGDGFALVFSAPGMPAVTSAPFKVRPGAPARLAFIVQPSNTTAGAALSPAVTVAVQDAFGNLVTSDTSSVTVDLSPNAAGATLLGTQTKSAVGGIATFSDLNVRKVGTGYTLAATDGSLSGANSAGFDITPGPANKLGFVAQPPSGTAGAPLAPAVAVAVQDAYGNTVANSTASITVDIAPNSNGATLQGTKTVAAVNGVATFGDLSVRKAGAGYSLNATGVPLAGASSATFEIAAAAPAALAFSRNPTNATAGQAIQPSVQVSTVDSFGNVTSSNATVTVALANNPTGATLAGTLARATVNGVASFDDLSLGRAGAGYTLRAVAATFPPATSGGFDVAPAAPAHLRFAVHPSNTNINQPITPAVKVEVDDAFGNVATQFNGSVSIALTSGTGALNGTTTRSASAGVAAFADLSVDTGGAGKVLTASWTGPAPSVASNAFTVSTPVLVYTDPSPTGKIALMKNPASTASTVVLDVIATQALTGYAAGMNLPLDASKVQPNAALLTPGTALSPGTGPSVAAKAVLASATAMLFSGVSQKAAGAGAVTSDTALPAGTLLYQLRLDIAPAAGAGVVFDGAALGPRFVAGLRDKLGNDVVSSSEVKIGKLEVQLQ